MQGVWSFLRGFAVFVAKHPELVILPSLRIAFIQLCRKYPEKTDQIEAALRYVAQAIKGGQVQSQKELIDLLKKSLEDIGVDDPAFQEAVLEFLDAFNAALASYIEMRGYNFRKLADVLMELARLARESRTTKQGG